VAVRGKNKDIWIAKVRKDYVVDKTKKGYEDTNVDVLWLIETKEYEGWFCMVEDEMWQDSITFGSVVHPNVEVKTENGLWVVGDMKKLRKLL